MRCCSVILARNNADVLGMKTVLLSQFRRRCSFLLKQVYKSHKPIQVTQFGRPLVEVRPPGLSAEERAARDARDVELLNRFADELNVQALGGLIYQAPISFEREDKHKTGRKKNRGL